MLAAMTWCWWQLLVGECCSRPVTNEKSLTPTFMMIEVKNGWEGKNEVGECRMSLGIIFTRGLLG